MTAPATRAPTDVTGLFDAVVEDLKAAGWNPNIVFGRREPPKQINQGPGRANRVVFEPGDPNGKAGDYRPVRYPGGNPRPLGGLLELITVYCWAWDPTPQAPERAHYIACRALHNAVYAAIVRKAGGNVAFSAPAYVVDNAKERFFGYEIAFTVGFQVTIPDLGAPETQATNETTFELDTSTP